MIEIVQSLNHMRSLEQAWNELAEPFGTPLLDFEVVEYMATLPVSMKLKNGVSKYLFRKACGSMLPPSVLAKRK